MLWGAGALLLAGALIAPAAHAQITFRAVASANAAAGTGGITHVGAGGSDSRDNCGNINPSIPGGSAGDILIALVNARENGATVTMPGWNMLYSDQYPGLTGNEELKVFIFWRFAAGGDPNTVTQSGTCSSIGAQIARFSGVDSTQPFENAPIPAGNVVRQNSGNLDTGTETTTVDGATILVAGFINDNRLVAEGGGWSQSFDTSLNVSRDLSLSVHYQPQASAGAISVSNWDLSGGGSDENYGIIFALRPATAGSGLTINVPAGTVANDVMIASVGVRPCSNTNGGACTVTVTPPAGWTAVNAIDQPTGGGTGGFGNRLFVYQRVATGAEPGNYTWSIGGAPQHAGAVGAIAGFSGVDTTSPIVVEAGQATPNSYDHTAPSIDTGGVTDTMLVSTHTANSAATWTVPAGMTEAVDVSSLPVPDALGIAMELNYELVLPAGATGVRTATHSNPPASDTGATHMLALRPVAATAPGGGFNAFETSTPGGSTTGVLKTKIAGTAFSFDIVSLDPGGTIDTNYNRTVRVELLDASNNSGALDADGCRPTWTPIYTLTPDPRFLPPDNGRITVGPFNVADAYPNVRVRVTNLTGPARRGCSTDNFAIRPDAFASFSFSDNDWQTAGTLRVLNDVTFGALTHKAGQPFTVRATAVNAAGTPAVTTNYAGTPATALTACVGAACTPTQGALTLTTAFTAGQLLSNTATYAEVGSFRVQLVDDIFAAVDNADSSLAERRIQSAVVDVGRFVPDHFAVSLNTPSFATACGAGSFTYVGQPFNYGTQPVVTVAAQNAANTTTTLYAGAWWRITAASLTGKAYTAASGTLDTSGAPVTDPVIAAAGLGTGTLTFSSGSGFFFTRTTPVPPFDAEISLAINVADLDGVAYATNPARFGLPSAGNGIAFSAGKELRFGRLRLANANGSTLVPVSISTEAQHWVEPVPGKGYFITNTGDSCTVIAAANVALGNYHNNLNACETSVTVSGFSGGRATIEFSAPGGANDGSVDVTANLGAAGSGTTCIGGIATPVTGANLPHLRGNWTGGGWDQDPGARAAFGVVRSGEEVIHIQEVY